MRRRYDLLVTNAERKLCRTGGGLRAPARNGGVVGTVRSLPVRASLAVVGLRASLEELRDREEGQALVEYALLLALIAVVSIAVLTVLGEQVSSIFSKISNTL
jgi:pilus assembly protein Flp/PilA